MYDIFFISNNVENNTEYLELKSKYPFIKVAVDFDTAQKKALTEFLWIVWDDIIVVDTFNFDYQPTNKNKDCVYTFLNGKYRDGVLLVPKLFKFLKNEIDCRYFFNKKDLDILASVPKPYERFVVNTYDEYLTAVKTSKTDLFWMTNNSTTDSYRIPKDYHIPHYEQFRKNQHHRFFNTVDNTEVQNIWLIDKTAPITYNEIVNGILDEYEMDYDLHPKRYDVVFISYNEPNANENFEKLLKIVPDAKRINGIKGIHQAHIAAAKKCNTEMFWAVDGDADILDTFNFDYQVSKWDMDVVHVWRSINPINDLTYGYGGVKLLPTSLTINMDTSRTDMTTSISSKFKAIKEVSNITAFNADPLTTWRAAFRETCKLSSKVIDRQRDAETNERLKIWCTVGKDRPYGAYAISGARAGTAYGMVNQKNPDKLKLINDFNWLEEQFKNANI